MQLVKRRSAYLLLISVVISIFFTASSAMAADNKLVIVTSFAADQTQVFKKAFEKQYPNITVNVINKGTAAGLKYLEETADNNRTDLFWVSSQDAFVVLKADNLLEKYVPHVKGLPSEINGIHISDPDGYFSGFALSGYGFMWNTRYLKAYDLPTPNTWADLTKPAYFGHLAVSAPSRSGSTHLEIESMLQGQGWNDGWAMIKKIGGNAKQITHRSFGVPQGVDSGKFGIGIVIDYFGFTSMAAGFPVKFHYPDATIVVPATIGVIANAPHPKAAHDFIDFVLSTKGQKLLFNPKVMRLPVNKNAYENAPEGIPNPFKGELKASVHFDSHLSQSRYNVVNSLFDVMITYHLDELHNATKAIDDAEAAIKGTDNATAQKLIDQAKALAYGVPVTAKQASDPDFNAIFTIARETADVKVKGRQAVVERKWAKETVNNYRKAIALAKKAQSML